MEVLAWNKNIDSLDAIIISICITPTSRHIDVFCPIKCPYT